MRPRIFRISRYRLQRLLVPLFLVGILVTIGLHIPFRRSAPIHIRSFMPQRDAPADFDDFDWGDENYDRLLHDSKQEAADNKKVKPAKEAFFGKIKKGRGEKARSGSNKASPDKPGAEPEPKNARGQRKPSVARSDQKPFKDTQKKQRPYIPLDHAGPQHTYRGDGLLEVNPDAMHPIFDLIRRAEEAWQAKLDSASQTLEEAVIQYKRRYGRAPPKGFDKWWDYVVEHDVQLPDEYDQINHDLEPFWGLRPSEVEKRQEGWETQPGTYTLAGQDGFVYLVGHTMPKGEESGVDSRAGEQLGLLKPIQQWIPDFRATFTVHDVPYQFIGNDQTSEAIEAASIGEYLDPEEQFDRHHIGWASACPPTSALRAQDPEVPIDVDALWKQPKTFIWDHKKSMDPCVHPSHAQLNGFLKAHGKGPVPRETLLPAFTMCTTQLHADILTVAMEQWTENVGLDPEWKDKKDDRLLWRGSNTGNFFNEHSGWNISQRIRLVGAANERKGFVDVLRTSDDASAPVGKPEKVRKSRLNRSLMDIAFAGSPIQCEPDVCKKVGEMFEFRMRQSWTQMNQYKYIFDIDGNGWSARFKRLMTTNSLILKSTIFPEWYTDRVQPWVHYAPIKNDLTDLYDVMTFFRGDIQGDGAHEDIAEMIATQGKQWSLTFWRKEDMVAYMFRLFLEYARVSSLDRDNMNFDLKDIKKP